MGAGFICGLLVVVHAIGNATLLARGELAGSLPAIVGVVLFAAAVLPIATAYLSDISGQVTTTQGISVIALSPVVGATAVAFSGPRDGSALLATTLLAIALSTALCGVVMLLLGRARLGRIIRFVPYPVFGGFLAMTGWYLLVGGLEIVVGHPLTLTGLAVLAEPGTAIKLASAIAFVTLVQVFNRRVAAGALLPLAVIAAVAIFNLVVVLADIGPSELQRLGWMIRVPSGGIDWPPVGWATVPDIDWRAVGAGLLFAPLVVLITTAAAMMNVSGIELEIRGDVDLDRELRSIGAGNVLSGLVGGIPGFPSVSATLTAVRLGAPVRSVGVVSGLVSLAALLMAPQLLRIVPAPLLGALLMGLGVSLLAAWVVRPLRTLRRSEHAIILIILAVSVVAGFVAGIGTGLLAALVLFVFEYSRVDGVRFVATGRDYQRRLLSDERRAVLDRHGASIVIMKLSGFLFFGTSERIIQKIADRLMPDAPAPMQFLIMDFRRVAGLDSSTVMSFDRLRRLAERRDLVVIFAGLGEGTAARLRRSGIDPESAPFHDEPDLDAAVAWAEDRLLDLHASETLGATPTADGPLAEFLGDEALSKAMFAYAVPVEFQPGEHLIVQGSLADDIFFIECGEGVVMLESDAGAPVRLMTFGPGTILGEVAFYRGEQRSASAVAKTSLKTWQLSRSALAAIERERPILAATFHFQIARLLADRLQSANRLIRVLAD